MVWDEVKASGRATGTDAGPQRAGSKPTSEPAHADRPTGSPDFYASLPTKHVAAACLFCDVQGRVLLVKPAYREPWELPGGAVEENESPLTACARELREELGIDHEPGRLLCVDYRPAVEGIRGDALRFVFDGGTLTAEDCEQFVLPPDELLEWRFVAEKELDAFVIPVMARRIRASLSADGLPAYREEGSPATAPR